ncbi:MAG: hypothetical protein V1720_17010 [bacterium]
MNHTYLFKEATWKADGHFFDETNKALSIQGETKIIHEENIWHSKSKFKLAEGGEGEFVLNLEVIPFDVKKGSTSWVSFNQSFGKFYGEIIIEDEYIISVFYSEEGTYSGSEYLHCIDGNHYKNKGVIFKGKEKLSSWSVRLQLIE